MRSRFLGYCLSIASSLQAMPSQPKPPPQLDYGYALSYVGAWGMMINKDSSGLVLSEHEFHGTVGSLDFSYSDQEHILHVWSFVSPGAAPLLTRRIEMKDMLDKRARQQPEETDGGVFDIRVLDWNRQVGPTLDPCLWLRLDIVDSSLSLKKMTRKLDHFSTTGYIWNRSKLSEVQNEYWRLHPKPVKETHSPER